MRKRVLFLTGLLVLGALFFFAAGSLPAIAADDVTIILQVGQPNLTINGANQQIDPGLPTAPVNVNGRVFVPIRSIIESMGGNLSWNGAEQKINISLNNSTIELQINSEQALVNGSAKKLDAPPYISSTGRTMLPLRFIIENLGSQVAWDGANQRITIDYTPPGAGYRVPAEPSVPTADFSGNWRVTVEGEDMEEQQLVLTQSGTAVTGYYGYDRESGHEFRGTVSGNTLTGKFYTTNPVTEWDFIVTMAAGGNSFDGTEYYSNPAWTVHGVKVGSASAPGSNTQAPADSSPNSSAPPASSPPPAAAVADFSGKWRLVVDGEDMGDYQLVLTQSGTSVTGYYGYDQYSGHEFRGTVSENTLTGKFYTITTPVTNWDFIVTMGASGNGFSGKEYYSNPAWTVHGVKQP